MPLSRSELKELRHPSESSRYRLTMFVLIPVGVLVAALTVATFGAILLFAPFILFVLWFSLRLYVASWMNNMVEVSEVSFPTAHAAIQEARRHFGYDRQVSAYVYQEGSYNAALLPLLNTKVLLLNSELMRPENSETELRFLIGRFVGALASKHYRFGWLQFFINGVEKLFIFNILLYPYERAIKLSGDRLGLDLIGYDLDTALSAMMKLAVGTDIADQVNIQAYVSQGVRYKGSFFAWLARAVSTFPHHTKRVHELILFARERNPDAGAAFAAGTPPARVVA